MEVEIPKWDKRFLDQAAQVATWSKDPSSRLGAVAVLDRRIVATGYNGFPEGFPDDEELYNDRDTKLKYVVHAEENAIYNAARYGVSLKGATLYVDGIATCSKCAKAVIQSGVKRVVMRYKPMKSDWASSFEDTKFMFEKCGVEFFCYEIPKVDDEEDALYISLHSDEVEVGDRVEKNEVDYEGYNRLLFDNDLLECDYRFPECLSGVHTITHVAISNVDEIIKRVIPVTPSPLRISGYVTPSIMYRSEARVENEKRECVVRGDEPSGQANVGNEAKPNIQEAVGLGRRHGSYSDIFRELSTGPWSSQDGVCPVGSPEGSDEAP